LLFTIEGFAPSPPKGTTGSVKKKQAEIVGIYRLSGCKSTVLKREKRSVKREKCKVNSENKLMLVYNKPLRGLGSPVNSE
jgi:hypothetical protein